ncbi:MAG: MBL fold metallo-hydrolase [Woeseiaceae bacterium]|nr:MBL fold metallo-hydrolase [Woeseiaceae bacterium]
MTVTLLAGCGEESGRDQHAPIAAGSSNELVENRGGDKDEWWQALPREEWSAFRRIAVDSDWFEVYAILDGVYAIYEPGQFEEVISFLIEGEARALLFDTGLGIGDMASVVRSLTNRPVVVVNSHTHYDHVGGNHQFDEILALDTAYTRDNARGREPGAVAEFVGPGWVWKAFPPGFDPDSYRGHPYRISGWLRDGDVIDLGGRRLEVLETPGHAPDALCLIDRDNRLLLTGDTFYLAPLYAHLEGSDFARYAGTAERLAALAGDVDRLLTAHNVPVVSSDYLVMLGDAFRTIASGRGQYALADGLREYDFGEFSVIVADEDP